MGRVKQFVHAFLVCSGYKYMYIGTENPLGIKYREVSSRTQYYIRNSKTGGMV